MNKIDLTDNPSDSPFIKDLLGDIKNKQTKKQNTDQFIIENNLEEFPMPIKAIEYLPSNIYIGTVFAIKGNTIFEFTTLPYYEAIDIRMSNKEYGLKTIVSTHNVCLADLNEFSNTAQFENLNDMESHSLDRTINFLMALVKNKFKLFTKS